MSLGLKDNVKGTCTSKCPLSEIKHRERHGLIHILETSSDRKVDQFRCVKEFSRSAAGRDLVNPDNLRPPEVLLETVRYLLGDVILNKRVPSTLTYHFISDRLRAIMQDMIVQNIDCPNSIEILEPVVRFYAFSAYWFSLEETHKFDPFLNIKQLKECLFRLLRMYDALDNEVDTQQCKNRYEFEAMHVLVNLGITEAITRGLNLNKELKSNDVVKLAMNLSRSFTSNNYVSVSRSVIQLPKLLRFVTVSIHLGTFRRKTYEIMSVAYNSKNRLGYPMNKLQELLLYECRQDIVQDLAYLGISFDEEFVYFITKTINSDIEALPMKKHLNRETFMQLLYLPNLLLFGEYNTFHIKGENFEILPEA